MKKQLVIEMQEVASQERVDTLSIELGPADKLEKVKSGGEENAPPKFQYTLEQEDEKWFPYLNQEWQGIFDPIKDQKNWPSLIIMGIVSTIFLFFSDMLGKGWRLQVTRRIGLDLRPYVPQFSLDKIGASISLFLRILKQGFVLTLMRQIYFLPLYLVSIMSGSKLLGFIWELFWEWWEGELDHVLKRLFLNVLPQAMTEFVIGLITAGLYVILVWPVYRILYMRYAVGEMRGRGFLSISRIRGAIGVYRRHAAEILGIYSFTLTLDVVLGLTVFVFVIGSVGILGLLAPGILLVTRFWMKGYAYGILARKLIAAGEFQPRQKDRLESSLS